MPIGILGYDVEDFKIPTMIIWLREGDSNGSMHITSYEEVRLRNGSRGDVRDNVPKNSLDTITTRICS